MGSRSKGGYKGPENRTLAKEERKGFGPPPKVQVIRSRQVQHNKHRRKKRRKNRDLQSTKQQPRGCH